MHSVVGRFASRALSGALLCSLSACITPEMQAFGRLNPQPNVIMSRRPVSLRVVVSPMIANEFTVQSENGISDVPVREFRHSVAAGFWTGPATYFVPRGAPRYTLTIASCDLQFVPSTVAITRTFASVVAARARISYTASVQNPDGDTVANSRGEVISSVEWSEIGGAGRAAEDALAKMWTDISKRMLTSFPMTSPDAPPRRPASSDRSQAGSNNDAQTRRVQTW